MMKPLEAARHEPSLLTLRYEKKFIADLRHRYFSDYEGDAAFLEESLWNSLEGAAMIYVDITDNGIPQVDIQAAQFVLKKLKPVIEKLQDDDGKNLQKISLGLLYLINRYVTPKEDTNSESAYKDIQNLISDGTRFRETLSKIAMLIEISGEIDASKPYRKNRYNALRAWAICMGMFWTKVAHKKLTLKKESIAGGVAILSQFGKFSEECLSKIGINTLSSLRSPLEHAQKHLNEDSEFERLLSCGDYAAAAKHLANRKDRFPIAML